MKRKYYALFDCDDHKDYSSMRLLGVFTEKKLRQTIRKKVISGEFEFTGNIIEILNEEDLEYIFNSLRYGFVQELKINEEL